MTQIPHCPDSEQALVSCFIQSPVQVGAAISAAGITPEHFHLRQWASLYAVMHSMWSEQKPIDLITVTDECRKSGCLIQVGGAIALTMLLSHGSVPSNISSYIEIVKEKHLMRSVLYICMEYSAKASEDYEDAQLVAHGLSGAVQKAMQGSVTQSKRTMKSLLKDKAARMESDHVETHIIKTGLTILDKVSPLKRGQMPLVCGETKSGKTMLALCIGAYVSAHCNLPVIYFSLEDSAEEPLDRVIANLSGVPASKHHKKSMTEQEQSAVVGAIRKIGSSKLTIRDDVFDLSNIVSVCRQHKQKHQDLALVIVDYAQLVRGQRSKNDNREQEIALISRTLRLLAIELNCVVMVLSQLNENGDTRESKALQNDMTAQWKVTMTDQPTKRLITIPRQRDGESGIGFPVKFLGHLARFEDAVEEVQQAEKKQKKRWDLD